MLDLNKVHNFDVLEGLKQIDSGSVDCVITSPPYWALRDYGVDGQLGLESTFQEYIEKLLQVFDEVKRVLKPSGTCWVNMGDTYYNNSSESSNDGRAGFAEDVKEDFVHGTGDGKCLICGLPAKSQFCSKECLNKRGNAFRSQNRQLPSKCLVGVPERFMLGMIDRGWILRNKIVWHKPNCMPSSARDRFTVDFEPIFFFVKSKKYYFDIPREAHNPDSIKRAARARTSEKLDSGQYSISYKNEYIGYDDLQGKFDRGELRAVNSQGRAGRTVWRITTQPFSEAHFATFPEELVKKPLLAGCPEFVCKKCGKPREKIISVDYIKNRPSAGNDKRTRSEDRFSMANGMSGFRGNNLLRDETITGWSDCGCHAGFEGGVVLDPFMGSGTVGVVARKNSRQFIGLELNKEYIVIANKRLRPFMEQTKLSEVL